MLLSFLRFYQKSPLAFCCRLVLVCLAISATIQNVSGNVLSEQALAECGLKPSVPGRIVKANKNGIVLLDDGRKLRLSGIWITNSVGPNDLSRYLSRSVIPFMASKKPDRTGSLPAHLLLVPEENKTNHEEPWLQAGLLANGQAFLYIYPHRISCASALRQFETSAMKSRTGIWSSMLHDDIATPSSSSKTPLIIGDANDFAIERAKGRYGIISGTVISTGKSGRWRYLNFGQNFSRDFTVRITAGVEKRLGKQGLTIKGLEDMHIQVRGVIQSKGGPMIDVFDAAQIVIME